MIFRSARHTENLSKIISFYTQVLGLEKLGDFKNHDGYDGVFLGKENQNWHLEFTSSNENVNSVFNEDDIFVFYPTTEKEYQSILKNIVKFEIQKHEPKNPYWKENGILIKDSDGYNIIISNQKI